MTPHERLIQPSEHVSMNRKQRRRASKLGQIPSSPSVKTGTAVVPPSDANLFEAGRQHHQAGRLAKAEACYRRVLEDQPDHADALHLLGIIAHQAGRHDLAVESIRYAIKQNGRNAAYFCSLGIALKNQGKLDEAVTSYRQAIRINPDLAEAHCNLGNALRDQGKLRGSRPLSHALRPDLPMRSVARARLDEALASYDRALTLRPDYAEALYNRGNILRELKRFEEALASYDRALALRPDHAGRSAIAAMLSRAEAARRGAGELRPRARVKPDYAEALNNRGNVLQELKRFDEALASYDARSPCEPDHAEALNNRGNALQGAEAVRRGAGELRSRARAAAGLCRGALQSRQHSAAG